MSRASAIERATTYYDHGAFETELARRVAIPSTSQDPEYAEHLERYLAEEIGPALEALGFTSRIHPGYYAVLAAATLAHFTPQVFFANLSRRFVALPVPAQAAVYAGLILTITGLSVGGPNFIYFQF